MIHRAWVVGLTAATLVLGGCSSSAPATPRVLHPHWRESTLPKPPGPPGRIAVRDATTCGGTWYVVGAVLSEDGASRPAAWTSSDGRTWRAITTEPTDFYARQAILYSVACHDAQVAAIGAKSGGAHGNPRTASWRLREDGVLQNVEAPFELYGGPSALSVNRVAGGPGGWVLAGARSSGAAVWVAAPDATRFDLVDHDPELASDATRTTSALDVFHDGDAWTTVGRAQVTGRIAPVPQAWVSTDGSRWTRQEVPAGTDGFADLERVARQGHSLLAVGTRGDRFGTWRRTGVGWRATESLGSISEHSTGAPFVSGLAATPSQALVAASDGAAFGLWGQTGARAWQQVGIPARVTNSGDDQLTVATDGASVLLLADDGRSGRVWSTDWSSLDR